MSGVTVVLAFVAVYLAVAVVFGEIASDIVWLLWALATATYACYRRQWGYVAVNGALAFLWACWLLCDLSKARAS